MNQSLLFVLVGIVIADAVSVLEPLEQPKPYSFGYKITDEEGNQQQRAEISDASGTVRGTFGYLDRFGFARQVLYVADSNGFRASVASNEPGVQSSQPAATIYSAADQLQNEPIIGPNNSNDEQPLAIRLSKSKAI